LLVAVRRASGVAVLGKAGGLSPRTTRRPHKRSAACMKGSSVWLPYVLTKRSAGQLGPAPLQ